MIICISNPVRPSVTGTLRFTETFFSLRWVEMFMFPVLESFSPSMSVPDWLDVDQLDQLLDLLLDLSQVVLRDLDCQSVLLLDLLLEADLLPHGEGERVLDGLLDGDLGLSSDSTLTTLKSGFSLSASSSDTKSTTGTAS